MNSKQGDVRDLLIVSVDGDQCQSILFYNADRSGDQSFVRTAVVSGEIMHGYAVEVSKWVQ